MTKISDKKWQMIDVEKIIPYDKNAKKHDKVQVEKIATSISKFGWRGAPIQVDENMVIINGHGRRLAAISLGMTKVPVVIESELTEEEVRAYRLADNRVAISHFDGDILQQEITELDYDLDGIFDKKELDFVTADVMEMDDSVFESNLTEVIDANASNTNEKIDRHALKRHSLTKLLGFKEITGGDAIYVTKFMAHIQAETGLDAENAFAKFCKGFVSKVSNG